MLDNGRNPDISLDKDEDIEEAIANWFVKAIRSVKSGRIQVNIKNEQAIQINAATNRIDIDLLHPELFRLFKIEGDVVIEEKDGDENKNEQGGVRGKIDKIKDKLNTAKEFAEKLTDPLSI